MTGRSARMDAAQVALDRRGLRRATRVVCAIAGFLCAVGVLSGGPALHAGGVAHHHPPHISAISTLAFGHGTNPRTDHHAIATPADPQSQNPRDARAVSTRGTSLAVVPVDSVRTRGPPALA